MEKVKISKSQADAINYLRNDKWGNETILKNAILDTYARGELYCLSDMNCLDLADALKHGFVVEETPEDKVKAQYESPKHFYDKDNDTFTSVYRKGIKFAIDAFDIKIEGIN